MMVCPAADDELVVPVEVVDVLELELELQAARSVAVATAAATAVVARRETQLPAPVRSVMEPPRGCLRGCGARLCGLRRVERPEGRVRKIDPMSACVNGPKARETRLIPNGYLACHPIFATLGG